MVHHDAMRADRGGALALVAAEMRSSPEQRITPANEVAPDMMKARTPTRFAGRIAPAMAVGRNKAGFEQTHFAVIQQPRFALA